MPHSDLLPSLLFKINENQLALEAAILELSNWVEQQVLPTCAAPWKRSTGIEEFIKMTLAVMMTP